VGSEKREGRRRKSKEVKGASKFKESDMICDWAFAKEHRKIHVKENPFEFQIVLSVQYI
jgi:hypothetical protein